MDSLEGLTAEEAAAKAADAKRKQAGGYEDTILKIAAERGDQASFTPEDVARVLSENWRPLLVHIRAAARRLAEEGRIEILRHGKPIDPAAVKGVIRLRLKQG